LCLFRSISDSSPDHWHDVLVGAVLGLVMAYFCYRQYYPSLATALSHRPYAPRHTLHPMHGLEHEDSRPLHGASSDDGEGDHDRENGYGNGTEHYSDRMDPHARAELQGTVPRQGAQDLTATWQNGEGRGSTVESQNQV
jgi:diacylglycerol diphosphate phosphatase/phosphatidate phosphatase